MTAARRVPAWAIPWQDVSGRGKQTATAESVNGALPFTTRVAHGAL